MRTNAKLLLPHDCKKLSISVVGVKKVAKIVHSGPQAALVCAYRPMFTTLSDWQI